MKLIISRERLISLRATLAAAVLQIEDILTEEPSAAAPVVSTGCEHPEPYRVQRMGMPAGSWMCAQCKYESRPAEPVSREAEPISG